MHIREMFQEIFLTKWWTRHWCEGVGLVNVGHSLFGRSAQVLYELQGEEVEGVRQEVREVNDDENGEINGEGEPHTS